MGPSNKVAILDAGAQYGKLIDRRIRELKVESHVVPLDSKPEDLQGKYDAIVISGGPGSCYAPDAPKFHPEVLEMGLPILGVCYGYQLLNYVKGGKVEKSSKREDLQETVDIDTSSPLFQGLTSKEKTLLTHGDAVVEVAPDFRPVAWSKGLVIAIENQGKKMFGTQFHPEVDLTENGVAIFKHFLFDIAKMSPDYTPESRHEAAIAEIRSIVGTKEILVLVSGGVDSSVCAALCREAVGPEKVHAVHIDHGFMRKNESETVQVALGKVGINLHMVHCADDFAKARTMAKGVEVGPLEETVAPEHKRMIIGDTFMRVTEQAVRKLGINADNVYLAQGTLRPDLIESGSHLASSKADVIKTHHNDTALVRELRAQGKIVEPLRDFHKDEVRALGTELGLPKHLVWRQPFPGPGLAIRCLCSDGSCPPLLSKEDMHKVEQLAAQYTKGKLSVCQLPVLTVGVQGDCRSYKSAVALSLPGEPKSSDIDWEQLFHIARNVPSEVMSVSRTCFMWGPPCTNDSEGLLDVTPTYCTQDVMEQLREADSVVTEAMLESDLVHTLSQVPVVIFPASFGTKGNRSIAIRPFITRDFMTGKPAVPGQELPFEVLDSIIAKIRQVKGISRVVYDLTAKPPGTTEWE
ncbi:hypothetical protein GUITHDRAFT_157428 [Guillardia theta CCMP2712]|uniref:GMP synthase (glutamine-hydrolyzing) n=2 Tax=Guillardia theta TaxID=55529 RepID=L1JM17_GUITC|nr:hypothetical protein GUITHDRAFT_157428 [Guillardia theta CCMP2712]EKX49437.1 hypothetical protein GUITHDRAFT_157428 [Guillardia theta CCMP2712]|mmetsp:Transcript_8575/g.28618  ORF Transcript_8575/g.28618 Transcript_8575/m.28618 type:complete len:635 (+) Transcript_8575:7-1911(+)|eukprot:XP_005836417.1 hypothetical protein GUITHDRAFT_157428 [Guillardia theta CCMP2712]